MATYYFKHDDYTEGTLETYTGTAESVYDELVRNHGLAADEIFNLIYDGYIWQKDREVLD